MDGKWIGSVLGIALLIMQGEALSQESYGLNERHTERLTEAAKISPVTIETAFGENLSLYNGGVRFSNIDASIPGTGPAVEFRRTFHVRDRREEVGGNGDLRGLGDWSIDLPSISGVYARDQGWQLAGSNPYARCSSHNQLRALNGFVPSEYWDGHRLYVPGQVDEDLLANTIAGRPGPTDGLSYPWITKSHWVITCKPTTKNGYPGEAFIAVSPDGVRYHLDWVVKKFYPSLVGYQVRELTSGNHLNLRLARERIYFLVSRVEDRFGNFVDYTYSGEKLTDIVGSDGRFITLSYTGNDVSSASSSLGAVHYEYGTGARTPLLSVTLPDASRWGYASSGELKVEHDAFLESQMPQCRHDAHGGVAFNYEISSPSGAKASYRFEVIRHWRQNVPEECVGWNEGNLSDPSAIRYIRYWQIPLHSDSYSLVQKTITGPGLTNMTWQYSYPSSARPRGFQQLCAQTPTSCPQFKQVLVYGPEPSLTRYKFGTWWGLNDGQLLSIEREADTGTPLRRIENSYVTAQEAQASSFGSVVGSDLHYFKDPLSISIRPLKKTEIVQDGVIFRTVVDSFDAFGRPISVTKSSTPVP